MALNYKIVLVGDGGSGKSSYVKRMRTGEFEKKYIATQGVDVSPLTFQTNYGPVVFKMWDCAGQEKFGGLRDVYYTKADGAIVMFDLTSKVTFANVPNWILSLGKVASDIPVIICGNKVDVKDRKVTHNEIKELLPADAKYYDISARSNYNFEKPFLDLARQLTGHQDLVFIESEPVTPPEVIVSEKQLLPSLPTPTYKWVHMVSLPDGGVMKVTQEYYSNAEILKY
jgi:GTP-binding nuclear protein Ran